MLDSLVELHAIHNPTELIDKIISIASLLIPSPAIAYNEINLQSRTAKVVHNFSPEADQVLPYMAQYIHENPIVANHAQHPDAATKFSDFMTRAAFRKTNFYNAFMRPLELERQLAIWVQSIPGIIVTVSLQRGRNDFTEQDRDILQMLGPHFRLAFMNAAKFDQAGSQQQQILSTLEQSQTGLIFLNSDGTILEATLYAAKCLDWFFGHGSSSALPEMLLRWLKSRASKNEENFSPSSFAPYVIQNDHGRLTIRASLTPRGQTLLLTHQLPPSRDLGQKLGLTRREAEVLFWLSEGKTDDEIARILGMSLRTAQKHVENIRRKLNVETRGAAARLLLELF